MSKIYLRSLRMTLIFNFQDIEEQMNMVDTFLNTYYKDHNYTEADAEEYVSHPLNTFSLIKRTAIDWPKVKERLFGNKTKEKLEKLLASLSEQSVTEKELEGAAGGLFLLAYTYEFNLTELASGQIRIPDAQCVERDIPRHILTISVLFNRLSFFQFSGL